MNSIHIRQALEQLPLPYLITDRDLHILWSNDCLKEQYPYFNVCNDLSSLLLGYKREELYVKLQTGKTLSLGCRLPMIPLTFSFSLLNEEEILVTLTPVPGIEKNTTLAAFNRNLKAPIHGLLGSISLLNHCLDEEYLPQLQTMSRDCYQMLRACMSISEYHEYISGSANVELQHLDLCDFLREELDRTAISFRHMGIHLTYSLPEEAVTLPFDPEKIAIVLHSLLSNSCMFGESDNEIHVSLSCNDKYAKVIVSDQGHGIPAEKLSQVMEPYYSQGLDEDDHPGLGLGLPLCKAIIEQHKGSFVLQSVQDQGTKAIFSLPLQQVCGAYIPLRSPQTHYGQGPYSKRNIFLSTVLPAVEYE